MKTASVLECDQCESDYGTLVHSELDITYCRKIENSRGRLVCTFRQTQPPPPQPADPPAEPEEPEGHAPTLANGNDDDDNNNNNNNNVEDGLPAGSFRRDCDGCRLVRDGTMLSCDACKRANGSTRYTIIELRTCKYFVNRDGTLRCDKTRSAQE